MELSRPDRKKLWGWSAARCNTPNCRKELFLREENDANIGKEAHICSNKKDGPRHDPNLIKTETYDNAILLCANHHDIIDRNVEKWTVEKLRQIKKEHEEWVRTQPGTMEHLKGLEKVEEIELELKKRELDIKEREISLKERIQRRTKE